MSTVTLWIPCEPGEVRVRLGFGDTLSPLEEIAVEIIGTIRHPAEPANAQQVTAETLSGLMGLGHRLVLDLVHDLWRAGRLVLDFSSGGIELSPEILEVWREGRLARLTSVETEERTIGLMVERLTGSVLPGGGPSIPGDPALAVRILPEGFGLAGAAPSDLQSAVRDWLHRQRTAERPDDDADGAEPPAASTWRRNRRILSIRTPSASPSTGGLRWLRVTVAVKKSEATGSLVVQVADHQFPADRRQRASELLTKLIEANPREQFVKELTTAAETGMAEPPSLAELIDRLATDAADREATVAGQRANEHKNLAADAARIGGMTAEHLAHEVDLDVVAGVAEHDRIVARLIDDAEWQLVIVSPYVRYQALSDLGPALRRAVKRGVRVAVVWGLNYKYTLPEEAENALASMIRASSRAPLLLPRTSARTHAKLVVRDDAEALVTSCNVLSTGHDREDVGVLLRAVPGAENQAIRDLLRWAQTSMPGALGRKVRHDAEGFGRREVAAGRAEYTDVETPKPPPDDDDHPESVHAWSQEWQAYAQQRRERLASRTRPSARVVEDGAHRELFWHAARSAKRRLVVASGLLSDDVVDSRTIDAFRSLAAAGVAVTVSYGGGSDPGRSSAALAALTGLAAAHPGFRLVGAGNPGKVLIWDDEVAVGSFNYLAQGGSGGSRLASSELSVRFRNAALADRLAAVCGEPEGVTARVSGSGAAPARPATTQPALPPRLASAVRELVDGFDPDGPNAGLVRSVLGASHADVDAWQVPALVPDGPLRRVVLAFCLTERAERAEGAERAGPDTIADARAQILDDLWRAGEFMPAAILRAADPGGDRFPSPALAHAVARRGLPGVGDTLLDAVAADGPAEEAEILLVLAVGELLRSDDDETRLALDEVAGRVGGPWGELAGHALRFADVVAGESVAELMTSVAGSRERTALVQAAWQQLERDLAEAQPVPVNISGALKTHAALFKSTGQFGKITDRVARRDVTALRTELERDFPPRLQPGPAAEDVLDAVWKKVAPGTALLQGRPRVKYVRRLGAVVGSARQVLALTAAAGRPAQQRPELVRAGTEFAERYRELRDSLTTAGTRAPALVGAVLDELDLILAGRVAPASGTEPVPPGLPGAIGAWPGRWHYPRLAVEIQRSESPIAAATAASLLVADLDSRRLPLPEAARRLIEMGEFEAADALREDHRIAGAAAEHMRAELAEARAAAVARAAHEADVLRRRAERAGATVPTGDVERLAADRVADAVAVLSDLRAAVEDAERRRSRELTDDRDRRLASLPGAAAGELIEAWSELVGQCIEAREFATAQRLIEESDPAEAPQAGPRTIPRLRDIWPFTDASREVALSWYAEGAADPPPAFAAWLPDATDAPAWELLSAVTAFADDPTERRAGALCVALQGLIGGGDHQAFPVERSGGAFRTRIHLPDYGPLPELPMLGRGGTEVWIGGAGSPPPADERALWLIPDFAATADRPPGVAVLDLSFLLRLVAPTRGAQSPELVRRINLLRDAVRQLGPGHLLAGARGAVSEPQVVWVLHLLGEAADGVLAEVVHHDCGGRLELLADLLGALLTRDLPADGITLDELNRIRGDYSWQDAALEHLTQPLADDRAGAVALWVSVAFGDAEIGLPELTEGIAAAGRDHQAELIVQRTDLEPALRRLAAAGLLEAVTADRYRLPGNGLRDLLTRRRPGHQPDDLAREAIEAEYRALRDAEAVRIAEISERVVLTIGHRVIGTLAAARSELDLGNAEGVSAALDRIGPIIDWYRAATDPVGVYRIVELLRQQAMDVYTAYPKVRREVVGDDDGVLLVRANWWILGQAFHNLFDNSRRASAAAGHEFGLFRATVSACTDDRGGPACRIDVEDDGPGFSATARAKIAAGARSSAWGGRDIGLATAAEWIRYYDGRLRICAEPSPLGGAHVRVELPLHAGPE